MSRNQQFRAFRWSRPIASIVVAGLVATNGQAAVAAPVNPSDSQINEAHANVANADNVLQALVADVSAREKRVAELELAMGQVRENVNKAMVDLETARTKADEARAALNTAKSALETSRQDLHAAQEQFNELAVTVMRQGYSVGSALKGAKDRADALNRSAALRREAEKQQRTIDTLDQNRTESANKEAQLRQAKNEAESAQDTAETRNAEAQAAYESANAELQSEQESYRQAQVDREAARAALQAAREAVNELNEQRREYESEKARQEAENAAAQAAAAQAEQEARAQAEAQANSPQTSTSGPTVTAQSNQPAQSGQAADSAQSNQSAQSAPATGSTSGSTTGAEETTGTSNTESQAESATGTESETSSQTNQANQADQAGQADSSSSTTGSVLQTQAPSNPESQITSSTSDSAKVEMVIARAMSQLGTPYAWGGGDANGPTRGIRDGGVADAHGDYNKIGFDCSGLTLYAFAAIGISLPHYTGYQYQRGTHYPASQMQRGDLIFYGPNGHGHVAIYLGDGTMIEAPQSGDVVKISQVRYNGMTPNVVRLV